MPLNPFLRAFFRSTIPTHCAPLTDYILLVPSTDILLHSRDRESGQLYTDLVQSEEFLGSHVLRVPKEDINGAAIAAARENRGKARQYSTSNGRTVIIKDTWVYTNKGFRTLNQAQLQNDILYWPNSIESQPWLIYYITRPLIGTLEHVSLTIKPKSDFHPPAEASHAIVHKKKPISSFEELLGLFPMIARQLQPGLKTLFHELETSIPELGGSVGSAGTSSAPSPKLNGGSSNPKSPAPLPETPDFSVDENAMRTTTETAITAAIELFQRVDQSQLQLLDTTTDLTGSSIEHLIERYICEQLHDTYVFPRLLLLKSDENKILDDRIMQMEYIDIGQVGIALNDTDTRKSIADRVVRGVEKFERMSDARSPQEMLDILLETAHTLTHSNEEAESLKKDSSSKSKSSGDDKQSEKQADETSNPVLTMNADMLVSLLLIVVIRSKIKGLQSCLTYMRDFVFLDDVEVGEKGYVLSTLEGVLFHITLDSEHMGRASHRNARLWDRIRKGNVNGVKTMLEKREDLSELDNAALSPIRDVPDVRFVGWDDEEEMAGRRLGKREMAEGKLNKPNGGLKVAEPEINGVLLSPNMDAPDASLLPEIFAKIESPKDKLPELIPELEMPENEDEDGTNQGPLKVDEKEMDGHPKADIPNGDIESSESHADLDGEPPAPETSTEESETSTSSEEAAVQAPETSETLSPDNESDSDELELEVETEVDEASIAPSEETAVTLAPSSDATSIPEETPKLKSALKTTFNPEVMMLDSKRNQTERGKLNRSISMRSETSRHSWSSSFHSLEHLAHNAPSLSEDLTSIEILSKTQNVRGESIVMMAVLNQQQDVLEYLIDESTYFPLLWLFQDRSHDDRTLLSAAMQGENYNIVRVIMEEVMKAPDEEIREYMKVVDNNGRTAGHYAFNQPTFLRHFGSLIPWNLKDKNGQTPLFSLCRSYDHPNYKEMVIVGIRAAEASQPDGERLHLDDHVDKKGNTLLHIIHDRQLLTMLLRRDADVNATNEKNLSPLMLASKYGRVDNVKTLFSDRRVDIYARESRGLTAVELAKDDEVRNKIDDMVMFSYPPQDDGRITAVVRGIFVEDATVRLVLKSGMPSSDMKYTITTCRRLLSDFEFLAYWLSFEHPASWLPALHVVRSPFQIPSKPSRAVLRDIQTQLDSFLRTLLSHSTFSTHELLWEFFLMPDMQPDSMMERSKRKCEIRSETVQEDFEPVENTKDVEIFMSHARDTVRAISLHTRSVLRRTNHIVHTARDLADAVNEGKRQLNAFEFMEGSAQVKALAKYAHVISPNDSSPLGRFLDEFRSVNASLQGMMTALERPRKIITEMGMLQKEVDKHTISLRRSDRWPLGLMDETRAKIHQSAADNIRTTQARQEALSRELRYSQSVAAAELASFHEMHGKFVRAAIRRLAINQLMVEREKLEGLKRSLRIIRKEV